MPSEVGQTGEGDSPTSSLTRGTKCTDQADQEAETPGHGRQFSGYRRVRAEQGGRRGVQDAQRADSGGEHTGHEVADVVENGALETHVALLSIIPTHFNGGKKKKENFKTVMTEH